MESLSFLIRRNNRQRKRRVIVVAFSLLLAPVVSNAVTHCTGRVEDALLYADGTVNILGAWRGDFTVICNTHGTFGGISAEVCLSWYATAVKAVTDGAMLRIYYAENFTCATLPTYGAAPVPIYVGLSRP